MGEGSCSLIGIDALLRWRGRFRVLRGLRAHGAVGKFALCTACQGCRRRGRGIRTLRGGSGSSENLLPARVGRGPRCHRTAARLLAARKIAAGMGGYVEAGQNASLLKGWRLVSGAGGISEVGREAALLVGRVLATEEGSYLLLGIDTDLLYSTSIEYVLIAGSGVCSFGTSAALRGNFASASQAYAAIAREREYGAHARRRGFESLDRKRNYDA